MTGYGLRLDLQECLCGLGLRCIRVLIYNPLRVFLRIFDPVIKRDESASGRVSTEPDNSTVFISKIDPTQSASKAEPDTLGQTNGPLLWPPLRRHSRSRTDELSAGASTGRPKLAILARAHPRRNHGARRNRQNVDRLMKAKIR